MAITIQCPQCKSQFDATEALQRQASAIVEAQLAEQQTRLNEKERELSTAETNLEQAVAERLAAERAKVFELARTEAAINLEVNLEAKEAEIKQTEKQLKKAQDRELVLLQEQKTLKDQAAEQELTLQRTLNEEREAIREQALAQAKEKHDLELAKGKQDLERIQLEADGARATAARLEQEAEGVQKAKAELGQEVERRLEEERKSLVESAKAQATSELGQALKAMEGEAEDARNKLKEAQALELQFLKEKRDLEERATEAELKAKRQLEEERKAIKEDAEKKSKERHLLELREKDLMLERMKTDMEALQKKLEQGSQQTQGEVQELVLEEILRVAFPMDRLEEVSKGAEGADVLQIVRDIEGRECGSILWESKRTKSWSNGWITKLHQDLARAGATLGAIASQALPKGIDDIGFQEGIWVCAFPLAVATAGLLRESLIRAATARKSLEGQRDKMSMLYAYLTSQEFQGRVKSVSHAWQQMLNMLMSERKAMEKIWAERQRLMTMAMVGMQGLHSDIQAIAGGEIEALYSDTSGLQELEALVPASSHKDLSSEDALEGAATEPTPVLPADPLVLESLFLAKLRERGGQAGNLGMRSNLEWTEERYEEIKQRLLAKNLVRLGKGKGGSIQLQTSPG